MADPIPVPVAILRLPRGPDSSGSRGFSREQRGRCRQDAPEDAPEDGPEDARCPAALQGARAALRERFLRLLGRARGRRARFRLCTGLRLLGDFGAADVHGRAIQVDSLQTPLGVQDSALLRSGDLLEFSFPLE